MISRKPMDSLLIFWRRRGFDLEREHHHSAGIKAVEQCQMRIREGRKANRKFPIRIPHDSICRFHHFSISWLHGVFYQTVVFRARPWSTRFSNPSGWPSRKPFPCTPRRRPSQQELRTPIRWVRVIEKSYVVADLQNCMKRSDTNGKNGPSQPNNRLQASVPAFGVSWTRTASGHWSREKRLTSWSSIAKLPRSAQINGT